MEALFELARRESDALKMLLASHVIANANGLRLVWDRYMTEINKAWQESPEGRIDLSDARMARIETLARRGRARSLRSEAIIVLWAVAQAGGDSHQRAHASDVLEELRHDPDEAVARAASWALGTPFEPRLVDSVERD